MRVAAGAGAEREGMVRERAYHIWEAEGRPDGGALEHWIRAQSEFAKGAFASIGADLDVAPETPKTKAPKRAAKAATSKVTPKRKPSLA